MPCKYTYISPADFAARRRHPADPVRPLKLRMPACTGGRSIESTQIEIARIASEKDYVLQEQQLAMAVTDAVTNMASFRPFRVILVIE